jgi:hypothetical protein
MRRFVTAVTLAIGLAPAAARAEGSEPPARRDWAFALYLDGIVHEDSTGTLVPTVFADRNALHLEARYNYEDVRTASLWAGYAFTFGDEATYLRATPMGGAVVGQTHGVAPGLEVDGRWSRFTYWLEAEYVFDFADSTENNLYIWSELDLRLVRWLWIGAAAQRLKYLGSPRDLQVGPAVGFGKADTTPGWSLTFYAFGLAREAPWYQGTLAVLF